MKRFLLSFLILILFSFNNAWCEIKYSVTNLGSFGGQYNYAADINNSGQVVGQSDVGGSTSYHAFIYNGNDPILDLGTFGGPDSYAVSINNNGQVAGSADADDGLAHLFLYDGSGPKQDLGTFNGMNTYATAINDSGQIVGGAIIHGPGHAFLYDGSGSMQDLGSLGSDSLAKDINNKGQIVGWSNPIGTGIQHAFIYEGTGPMQDMNDLINPSTGWTLNIAKAINDKGQIVGQFSIGDSGPRAFFYDVNGSFKDIGTLGTDIYVGDINNLGQVVGSYNTADLESRAFIYSSDGILEDLNDLIDPSLGWILMGAGKINDNGQIISNGYSNGNIYPLILTPIPEPCSIVLLSIGAFSFLAYSWRRRGSIWDSW